MTNGWMLNGEWTCAVCGDVDGAHHDNCLKVASCRNGGNDTPVETCKKCGAGLVYGEVDGDLCTDCEFTELKAEIAAIKSEVERLKEDVETAKRIQDHYFSGRDKAWAEIGLLLKKIAYLQHKIDIEKPKRIIFEAQARRRQSRARAWKRCAKMWRDVSYRHYRNCDIIESNQFVSYNKHGHMIIVTKALPEQREKDTK